MARRLLHRIIVDALRDYVLARFPGGTIEEMVRLGIDQRELDATRKGTGYGIPVRIRVRDAAGHRHTLVFHTARADEFGHDRRSDRAAEMLLAFDTFGRVPRHVPALDVGVVGGDGRLRSISDAGELYLLTAWAEGAVYAEDLRRVARDGASRLDERRVDVLADYLSVLHRGRGGSAAVYTRAVRDLIGSGEGIFGMIDGYGEGVAAASGKRLRAIEEKCVTWRWRMRRYTDRLAPSHGDFHPFNIVFARETDLSLLDASRGAAGEPADDVTALAVNYVFFALDRPGAWARGLGRLWHRLWRRYLDQTGDHELIEVAPPWLAWRALVVANPRWYPDLSRDGRDRLLTWIESVLTDGLDLDAADAVAP